MIISYSNDLNSPTPLAFHRERISKDICMYISQLNTDSLNAYFLRAKYLMILKVTDRFGTCLGMVSQFGNFVAIPENVCVCVCVNLVTTHVS